MNEKVEIKKNNYLKREDFLNLVDNKKIWSKSMTIDEVKYLLDFLEKEIDKYNYVSDKDFLMDGRRQGLKLKIESRLSNNNKNISENVLESLFNFWEFVNNEYYVASLEALERLNIKREELEKRCNKYTQDGIICLEEKNVILEIIQILKKIVSY